MVTRYAVTDSPIGPLLLVAAPDGDGLAGLYVADEPGAPSALGPDWEEDPAALAEPLRQLEEWFAGQRREFDLELRPAGTPFQLAVWEGLRLIPYGETWSYGDLARHVGKPGAARAVGRANGRNPISIVVPCHRVIGADGSLTGFGWGVDRKAWLLDHERKVVAG